MRFATGLQCCALGIMGALTAATAAAQAWPARPVRIIVPYATGGGTDILLRQIGQKIGESTGQQFVVDNRPGANGITGTDVVAKSPADGYTLVGSTNALTINPALYRKIPFAADKDLTAVTIIAVTQNLLAVHPSVPATTTKELIALARSRPGQLAFGSGGAGQPSHLSGELFKLLAKVDMLHVPYKGSGASITDLIAGQIATSFSSFPSLQAYVRSGKLRAIATCGARRSQAMPDVPTVGETLPGYEVELWFGMLGPAGMPKDIVTRLHGEIVKALAQPDLRDRLTSQGYENGAITPDEFAAKIRAELPRWQKVVQSAGIRME